MTEDTPEQSTPGLPDDLVEAVARVIDPDAWSVWGSFSRLSAIQPSLEKARAILALPAITTLSERLVAAEGENQWSKSLFGFYAETGTAGADEGCNALFFDWERAADHVRKHGGYVRTLYRAAPPPPSPLKEEVW